MRIENVSLPYPVLGISDDITPTLEDTECANPVITIGENSDLFFVTIALKLENKDICNYIQNKYAEYTVEVSCASTMYRKCITSPTSIFTFTVEKKKLNGRLDFESYVIAKKDIINYKNAGLNSDYDGHIINLHRGDLLVAYRKCSIPLNLDLRNVRNMKSFMTVQKNNKPNERSVTYSLESSKIIILLPEEMMVEYNKKPSNTSENKERKIVLKASLYLQALTYALLHYQKYKDENYMWVNAIGYRLNEPDIKEYGDAIFSNDNNNQESQKIENIGALFKLAHMMLNQPYLDMLKEISCDDNYIGQILNDE